VLTEFQELGLAHDLALASVDACEALLVGGRSQEIKSICRDAMQYFKKASLAYTRGALTALAYLHEAADSEALTTTDFGDVRAFFEILPKQPELLFARPA